VRVLVLEGEQGAAAPVEAELRAAGHHVARCYDEGASTVPCKGMMTDEPCPLDAEPIDAALLVRDTTRPVLHGGEDGARCALRRFVPLVLHGDVDGSPYLDWATLTGAEDVPVADILDRARQAPLLRHADAARRSLRAVLEQHALDPAGADAEVRRRGPDLQITLTSPADVDRGVADMASVRAVGAVRDVDPYPRVIDVSFVTG
jgi:hypothetical protein